MVDIRLFVAAILVGLSLASAQVESPGRQQKLAALAQGDAGPVADERGSFPNDECFSTETTFSCNTFAFAHTGSGTTNVSDPQFPCAFGGARHGTGSNWMRLIVGTPNVTITTSYPDPTLPNGFLPDTLLAVYSGACGSLTQLACNDDIDFANNNFLSRVTLNTLTIGQVYYLQVAAYGLDTRASYTVSISDCALPNDECTGAQEIVCNQQYSADTRGGTTRFDDPLFPCRFDMATQGVNSLWYRFTARTPIVRFYTGDADPGDAANDTLMAVYTGVCGGLTQIACDDDSGPGFFSEIALNNLVIGQQYYVEVAAFADFRIGPYLLNMECRCESTCPPGAHVEAEVCGTDTNGGCYNASAGIEPVQLGDVICGRFGFHGALGDFDIYGFDLTRTAMIYWIALSDLGTISGDLAILNNGCPGSVVIFNSAGAEPCNGAITHAFLSPGSYQGGLVRNPLDCPNIGGRYLACATIGPACRGDADGDGDVDFADITAVLQVFGRDYRPFPGIGPGDANFNGVVAFADVTAVLENFNTACFSLDRAPPEPAEIPADSPWFRPAP